MVLYTGAYGLVVEPDRATQDKVGHLVEACAYDAQFVTPVPHLTLYHTTLSDAPEGEVRRILKSCNAALPRGTKIPLGPVAPFDKFLFWDAIWKENQDLIRLLWRAHHLALGLADHRDQGVLNGRQAEEKLNLSAEQEKNVKRYGHPLVGAQWRPHLTLAYDPNGFKGPYPGNPHTMEVVAVRFVRIGQFGSVAGVIF